MRAASRPGDTVVALVRDPAKAACLAALGAELVEDDLSDVDAAARDPRGRRRGASTPPAAYRVGITASERPAMWDANVGTTTRLLEAADGRQACRASSMSRRSTCSATRMAGSSTRSYRRDLAMGFLSSVRRDQVPGARVAERRIDAGRAHRHRACRARSVGPGDQTGLGEQLGQAYAGTLPYLAAAGRVRRARPMSTTSPPASSRRSTRGRSASAYMTSRGPDTARRGAPLAAKAGGSRCPGSASRTGSCGSWRPFGGSSASRTCARSSRPRSGVTYLARRRTRRRPSSASRAAAIAHGLRDTFANA